MSKGYVVCTQKYHAMPDQLITREVFATKAKAESWLYDWLSGGRGSYMILRANDKRVPWAELSHFERLATY